MRFSKKSCLLLVICFVLSTAHVLADQKVLVNKGATGFNITAVDWAMNPHTGDIVVAWTQKSAGVLPRLKVAFLKRRKNGSYKRKKTIALTSDDSVSNFEVSLSWIPGKEEFLAVWVKKASTTSNATSIQGRKLNSKKGKPFSKEITIVKATMNVLSGPFVVAVLRGEDAYIRLYYEKTGITPLTPPDGERVDIKSKANSCRIDKSYKPINGSCQEAAFCPNDYWDRPCTNTPLYASVDASEKETCEIKIIEMADQNGIEIWAVLIKNGEERDRRLLFANVFQEDPAYIKTMNNTTYVSFGATIVSVQSDVVCEKIILGRRQGISDLRLMIALLFLPDRDESSGVSPVKAQKLGTLIAAAKVAWVEAQNFDVNFKLLKKPVNVFRHDNKIISLDAEYITFDAPTDLLAAPAKTPNVAALWIKRKSTMENEIYLQTFYQK